MEQDILVIKNLSKEFKGQKVLEDITMHIPENCVYGLLGPNGAGKSTLLKMITGLLRPSSGAVFFRGHKWTRADLAEIGALIETPPIYENLTAWENMKVRALLLGVDDERIQEVLKLTDIADTGKKKAGRFSMGMKQRLGIALALLNHPRLLVLDEPINGLDPEGIVELREILLDLNRQRQTTILISSHILSELSNVADHYGFLDKGHMLEQISAKALEEKCRACLELKVDDAPHAARVLEQKLATRDYEVLPEGVIRLYSHLAEPQNVSRALVEEGVALWGMEQRGADLEDYFLSLIGGVHHA